CHRPWLSWLSVETLPHAFMKTDRACGSVKVPPVGGWACGWVGACDCAHAGVVVKARPISRIPVVARMKAPPLVDADLARVKKRREHMNEILGHDKSFFRDAEVPLRSRELVVDRRDCSGPSP